MPDNGKNIDKAKQKALDLLNSRIDDMGEAARSILLETIEKTFDFKSGEIEVNKNFIKQLNRLTVEVLDLIQSTPKFTGPVSQFVKRMQPISEAITDFQKNVNGVKVPNFDVAKNVVIDEVVDKMLNNGLNQKFVLPLRDLIYQNATTGGLSLADARIQIKELVGTGTAGKLGQYVEQTAIQAVDAYSGAINTKLLETFSYDGLLITGSLIDNSSKQCRFAIEELGGKITRENWAKVEAIGKKQNGWIDGTTFDNLPTNRLHWGCRHSFYPIILKKTA